MNLESLHLANSKPLTTNQSDLLNKIILRYSRQLSKQELFAEELVSLPWTREPIPSLPQFTEVHLLLVDDELILRTPYKNTFVKDFKKLDLYAKWEHDDKFWRIPASSHTLSRVDSCINHHFNKVNYCDVLRPMIESLDEFKNTSWDPVYKVSNGNFYVGSITPMLYDAIEHISFDTTLDSLARIVACGIEIHDSVLEKFREKYTESQIRFAVERVSKIEIGDFQLNSLILDLKPDAVVFMEHTATSKTFLLNTKEFLKTHNIEMVSMPFSRIVELSKFEYPIIIEPGISHKQIVPYANKIIQMVNSSPIHIK